MNTNLITAILRASDPTATRVELEQPDVGAFGGACALLDGLERDRMSRAGNHGRNTDPTAAERHAAEINAMIAARRARDWRRP